MPATWKKSYDKPRDHIKNTRHHFANKGLYSQSYGLSSSHVWMWELNHRKGRVLKKRYFLSVVLEKTLESLLDRKEIKPISPKGNQPWIFIERMDTEALILRPPVAKSQLIGKDPDARRNWRQQEKGAIEGEMVGGHHKLNGHEFEQTPGDGEGQGSLACYSPRCCKELDMTEQLNNRG